MFQKKTAGLSVRRFSQALWSLHVHVFEFLRRGAEPMHLTEEPKNGPRQEGDHCDHQHIAQVERLHQDLGLAAPAEYVAEAARDPHGEVRAVVLELIQELGGLPEQEAEDSPPEDGRHERQCAFAGNALNKVLHLVPPNVA